MTSGVIPQVILGNRVTGIGADDTRESFNKYNNHSHWTTTPPDFRHYPIEIGQEVRLYDCDGNNVFGDVVPGIVEYISGDTIRVSVPAEGPTVDGGTVENGVLFLGAAQDIQIPGVDSTDGSALVVFTTIDDLDYPAGLPGFVNPQQAEILGAVEISGQILGIVDGVVPLAMQIPYPYWLVGIRVLSPGFTTGDHFTGQLQVKTGTSVVNYGPTFVSNSVENEVIFVPYTDPGVSTSPYPATQPTASQAADSGIYLEITGAVAPGGGGSATITEGDWVYDIGLLGGAASFSLHLQKLY